MFLDKNMKILLPVLSQDLTSLSKRIRDYIKSIDGGWYLLIFVLIFSFWLWYDVAHIPTDREVTDNIEQRIQTFCRDKPMQYMTPIHFIEVEERRHVPQKEFICSQYLAYLDKTGNVEIEWNYLKTMFIYHTDRGK